MLTRRTTQKHKQKTHAKKPHSEYPTYATLRHIGRLFHTPQAKSNGNCQQYKFKYLPQALTRCRQDDM